MNRTSELGIFQTHLGTMYKYPIHTGGGVVGLPQILLDTRLVLGHTFSTLFSIFFRTYANLRLSANHFITTLVHAPSGEF